MLFVCPVVGRRRGGELRLVLRDGGNGVRGERVQARVGIAVDHVGCVHDAVAVDVHGFFGRALVDRRKDVDAVTVVVLDADDVIRVLRVDVHGALIHRNRVVLGVVLLRQADVDGVVAA
jgi:hypothetical protein